jgi:hypothetical protein
VTVGDRVSARGGARHVREPQRYGREDRPADPDEQQRQPNPVER